MRKCYSIFFIGFNGSLYEALVNDVISIEHNEFLSEESAWECLMDLNGLNGKLTFTVLPVYKKLYL